MHSNSAIKANDRTRFTNAFANLTAACNVCHEAAQVGLRPDSDSDKVRFNQSLFCVCR